MAEESAIQSRASGYFGTFVWAILVGMGLHIGWGLISLIVWVAAKSLNQPGMLAP